MKNDNTFVKAMLNDANRTYTENGRRALKAAHTALLTLHGVGGALRSTDPIRVCRLYDAACEESPLLATKEAFYIGDIRGGLGERKIRRILLKHIANRHPENLVDNIALLGEYGRFDDMYELIGTKLESEMWSAMSAQFEQDRKALAAGQPVSLLAKWIKTPDASSKATRKLGIMTAIKLGYSVYEFKRILKSLRAHLKIVEAMMSANRWDEIDYSAVPSRASMIYRNAFARHDEERYGDFIQAALAGNAKINAATLYPYDIVEKSMRGEDSDTLEALWRQLPDYVGTGRNAVVMADVSGSMTWTSNRPLATSIGLALYFAERNTGAYRNVFMTFSTNPEIVSVHGVTLVDKLNYIRSADWGGSTNLEAAFRKILDIALENGTSPEDMPESLIVISDMEIDAADSSSWSFHDDMAALYKRHGYDLPKVVFWNVESRNDTFLADGRRPGVFLASGQSPVVFKSIFSGDLVTAEDLMLSILESERYAAITVRDSYVPRPATRSA